MIRVCIGALMEGYQNAYDLGFIWETLAMMNLYNYDISCQTLVVRPNSWFITVNQATCS